MLFAMEDDERMTFAEELHAELDTLELRQVDQAVAELSAEEGVEVQMQEEGFMEGQA